MLTVFTSYQHCDDVHESTSVQATISINEDTEVNALPLSMSCKDAGMPEEMYEGMWRKASHLVAKGNAITDAPGLQSCKMVYSSTNPKKPHLIRYYKNGKLTCECLNYTTKSICAHTLSNGRIVKFTI